MSIGTHIVNFAIFLAVWLPPSLLLGFFLARWNAQTESAVNSDPDGSKEIGERVAIGLGQVCLVLLYAGAGLWLLGNLAVLLVRVMQATSKRTLTEMPDIHALLFMISTTLVAIVVWMWADRMLKYIQRL